MIANIIAALTDDVLSTVGFAVLVYCLLFT